MPSERSKPSEITGENAARSKVRSISLATCCKPFWTTTSVTGSIAVIRRSWSRDRSRTRHGVDLRGSGRQGTLGPALAAVGAGEHLPPGARAIHSLGLARIERHREHRRLRLEAHVHAAPARAAVRAAEERADFALEVRATGHPDGLRIAGDLSDVAAIRLPLRIQRLEPRARPVLALVRAGEQAGAPDGEHGSWTPSPDQHAVHVHGVVVHVLAVAHVLPVLATVEAADDAAHFDGAVELARIGGIRGQLQDSLGGIGAGRHRDFGEADGHGQLLPAIATVVTPKDLAVLVAGVQHVGIARIE